MSSKLISLLVCLPLLFACSSGQGAPTTVQAQQADSSDPKPKDSSTVDSSTVDSSTDDLDQAQRDLEQGNLEAASEFLAARLESQPDDRRALDLMGRLRFEQGNYSEAKTLFERAIAIADDDDPMTHLWLGKVLAEEIDRTMVFAKLPLAKQLHRAFLRAVEIDPEHVIAHAALARYHLEAPAMAGGDPQKMRQHTDRLHALDAAAAHRMEARIHLRADDVAAAERELRLAVAANPDDAESVLDLGSLLLDRSQPEEALTHLQRAVDLDARQHLAHYRLAEAALLVEPPRLQLAAESLARYLERHPTHDLPSRAEAWTLRGQVDELMGGIEAARQSYTKALGEDPRHKEAQKALDALPEG